jgi:hypothetical protein
MLRRVPARGERQGDRERCPGNAQEAAENQRLLVAVDTEVPGEEQGDDDDHLADGPGHLRLQVVDQDAHENAQDRAGEHRGGHHHALLGVREAEIRGDLHAERAEHHPDHEGEVEIEKCRV